VANAIKFSTSGSSNSLRKGNCSFGTNQTSYAETADTGFWNGMVIPTGGYIIYQERSGSEFANFGYSAASIPDGAALIKYAQQSGASNISTAGDALAWIATQPGLFCVNQDYPGFVTEGLIFNLDSTFLESYPTQGNTWYDISGNSSDFSLINGATLDQVTRSLIFDGTDQFALKQNASYSTTDFTIEVFLYPETNTNSGVFAIAVPANDNALIILILNGSYIMYGPSNDSTTNYVPSLSAPLNTWQKITRTRQGSTEKVYFNGQLVYTLENWQSGVSLATGGSIGIGLELDSLSGGNYSQIFKGKIFQTTLYNRALSDTEVLQNYNSSVLNLLGLDWVNYNQRVLLSSGQYVYVQYDEFANEYEILKDSDPSILTFPFGYKTSVLFSTIPQNGTGDFSLSRNGSASYFDQNGIIGVQGNNVPRVSFNPTTQDYEGVYVEKNSTNLFTYSQDFNNPIWLVSDGAGIRATIFPEAVISPDGTLNASLLVPSTLPNTEHPMRYNGSAISASVWTSTFSWSIFVKPAGNNYFGLRTNVNNVWSAVFFNLSNGTVYSASENYTSYGIQALENGWFRCYVVAPNSTIQSIQHISSPNGSVSFTGDGTSGTYIWGAQLEVGEFMTSYIPTAASQVTRPVDSYESPALNYSTSQWGIFFDIEYLFDMINEDHDTADVSMNPLIWYFRRLTKSSVNFWNQNAQQNLGSFTFSPANSVKRFKGIITFNGSTISTFVNGTKVGNQITPTNLSPFSTLFSSGLNKFRTSKTGLGLALDSAHVLKASSIYTRYIEDAEAIDLTTI
jgi:hypothetical protein